VSSTTLKKISLATAGAVVIALAGSGAAQAAGFSGAYAPANWSLANFNADGFVNTTNAPTSITITGGNNGSISFGRTTYVTTAAASGWVSFDWNYSTQDFSSFYDPFRFVLHGSFTQLTINNLSGQSGSFSTSVTLGDTFGFYVSTQDNFAGRGSSVISNFMAPASTPEPTSVLGSLALGGLGIGSALKRKVK
jgi:hypothetical protein